MSLLISFSWGKVVDAHIDFGLHVFTLGVDVDVAFGCFIKLVLVYGLPLVLMSALLWCWC